MYSSGSTVRCVHSLLRQGFADLKVRLVPPVHDAVQMLYGPTIQTAPWSTDQTRRARARLLVRGVLPGHAVAAAMQLLIDRDLAVVEITTAGVPAATLTSTRAVARARRWEGRLSYEDVIEQHFGTDHLEVGPGPPSGRDLAEFFARAFRRDGKPQ